MAVLVLLLAGLVPNQAQLLTEETSWRCGVFLAGARNRPPKADTKSSRQLSDMKDPPQ